MSKRTRLLSNNAGQSLAAADRSASKCIINNVTNTHVQCDLCCTLDNYDTLKVEFNTVQN